MKTQQQKADLLGISQPAVNYATQYIKNINKRLPKNVKALLELVGQEVVVRNKRK